MRDRGWLAATCAVGFLVSGCAIREFDIEAGADAPVPTTTTSTAEDVDPSGDRHATNAIGEPPGRPDSDVPLSEGDFADPFVFYSGNDWNSAQYAIAYAICESAAGPCIKADDEPLIASTGGRAGPGGAEIVAHDGRLALVYHAWTNGDVGYATGGERRFYLQPIRLDTGAVTLA